MLYKNALNLAPKTGLAKFMQKLKFKNICKNEKLALRHSDKIMVLSSRDLKHLHECYPTEMQKHSPTDIFTAPVSMANNLSQQDISAMQTKKPNAQPVGLFLGSLFDFNLQGIKWFVENVAEHTNANYIIAGKDFDKVAQELTRPNVQVLGRQDDIKKLYMDADFCIGPIFAGSGMKVKTCEALMYGKTIFATDESLSGYNPDFEKIGALCNTAEEFITAINKFAADKTRTKFNQYNHQFFLENHSNQVLKQIFYNAFHGKTSS
jgi:hypothetical protein